MLSRQRSPWQLLINWILMKWKKKKKPTRTDRSLEEVMMCSNYMNFIQQRHAAGQKCKYLPLSHRLLREAYFQLRGIWMSDFSLGHSKAHIWLPQKQQILQEIKPHSNMGSQLTLVRVARTSNPHPLKTVTFMQKVPVQEESNTWACRAVKIWVSSDEASRS